MGINLFKMGVLKKCADDEKMWECADMRMCRYADEEMDVLKTLK